MAKICRCKIVEVTRLNERYYLLKICAPEIALEAYPGQFVNVQVGEDGSSDPLLKRPFSIHQIDQQSGFIWLLIKQIGAGTERLSKICNGKELEIIGPLGNGFKLQQQGRALLIAGGIGVAPLKELAIQLKNKGVELTLLLGISEEKDLALVSVIEEFSPDIIMINPGKTGYRQGLITELVRERLAKDNYDQIYTCGPEPMLKALQKQLGSYARHAQFSVEERMGCGVGLCFSCVTKIRRNEDKEEWKYERVCTCGPVFSGDEVVFS